MGTRNLTIRVKEDVLFSDFQNVSPSIVIVLGYFSLFCHENSVPCRITSVKEAVIGRVSRTHADGRAFDASLVGWKQKTIDKCVEFMQNRVGWLGAISRSDNERRVVIVHDSGHGNHFHFQTKD
jgi:hypothetical protein